MANELILVGINHTDSQGEERLERALDKIRPDILTLELPSSIDISIPPVPVNSIIQFLHRMRINERIDVERTRKLMSAYGFELRSALRYKESGKNVVCVGEEVLAPTDQDEPEDLSQLPRVIRSHETAAEYFINFLGMYTSPQLTAFIGDYLHRSIISESELRELEDAYYGWVTDGTAATRSMDGPVERNIRKLLGGKTIMHVGGMTHIYSKRQNLYEMMQDLKPVKYKLNEF